MLSRIRSTATAICCEVLSPRQVNGGLFTPSQRNLYSKTFCISPSPGSGLPTFALSVKAGIRGRSAAASLPPSRNARMGQPPMCCVVDALTGQGPFCYLVLVLGITCNTSYFKSEIWGIGTCGLGDELTLHIDESQRSTGSAAGHGVRDKNAVEAAVFRPPIAAITTRSKKKRPRRSLEWFRPHHSPPRNQPRLPSSFDITQNEKGIALKTNVSG